MNGTKPTIGQYMATADGSHIIRRGDWFDGKLMSYLLNEHIDPQWRLAQDNPARYYRYTQHRNAFVGLTAVELLDSYDSMRQE
jgi:hypothetical protein